jgi:S-adenosylmethionine/arginine decarboxylase-like enzyme
MFESAELLPESNNFSRRLYELEHHLYHRHLIVNAVVNNPPKCPETIELWTRNLVAKLGMNVLIGPHAVYSDKEGNRGLTCITAIDTSSITLHTWDEIAPAHVRLDVYTCSLLNPADVYAAMSEWDIVSVDAYLLDRDADILITKDATEL